METLNSRHHGALPCFDEDQRNDDAWHDALLGSFYWLKLRRSVDAAIFLFI